jgi:hypothetical protein
VVVTDSPGPGKPDALFVVSLETGEKRQLTNPQPPAFGDTHPAVSPDGRWLVFERELAPPSAELYLLPLGKNLTAGGEIRRLPFTLLNWDYTTWMPDGKEILFSSEGSLWRAAVPGDHPPVRVPFVGEDGIMPVVARPQPASVPAGLCSQHRRPEHLAHRDVRPRRSGVFSAPLCHRLHEGGQRPAVFTRRPPRRF